jgi:hypothetical protein
MRGEFQQTGLKAECKGGGEGQVTDATLALGSVFKYVETCANNDNESTVAIAPFPQGDKSTIKCKKKTK